MLIFINLNNHDVTAHIQEQVGPSPWTSTFYLLIGHPVHVGELFSQVRSYGVLLRLIVPWVALIREQWTKQRKQCPLYFRLATVSQCETLHSLLPSHSLQRYFRMPCVQYASLLHTLQLSNLNRCSHILFAILSQYCSSKYAGVPLKSFSLTLRTN